jgi:hypothetical protein
MLGRTEKKMIHADRRDVCSTHLGKSGGEGGRKREETGESPTVGGEKSVLKRGFVASLLIETLRHPPGWDLGELQGLFSPSASCDVSIMLALFSHHQGSNRGMDVPCDTILPLLMPDWPNDIPCMC